MDDQLALRIQLFREGGQVRPEVAAFVSDELTALADEGHVVTEDTAGMLTSHLMVSLTAVLDGEAIDGYRTDELVAAELVGQDRAVLRARSVASRAKSELGAVLPDSEVNFLALHLAVLAQRSPA